MLPPQIFIRAGDWPGLDSAHPNEDGGCPKNFWSLKCKIWLKIQRVSHYDFGASGSILTKHFPYDVPRGRVHNMGITFRRHTPKIWEGERNVQNSARFLTNFDCDREYLRNYSRHPKSERNVIDGDSSRVPEKIRWTLTHKQKSFVG